MNEAEAAKTLGYDAITEAVGRIVPEQEPLHCGTNTLPGQDGIYGVSAYRVDDQWLDHWLLVTYGLTEVFGKASDGPAASPLLVTDPRR